MKNDLLQAVHDTFGPVEISEWIPEGRRTHLLRLRRPGGSARACVAKRCSRRERLLYQSRLKNEEAPALYGAAGAWTFLEKLDGEHPDFSRAPEAVAWYRWLGELHLRHAGAAGLPGRPPGMDWPAGPRRFRAVLETAGLPSRIAQELELTLSSRVRTLIHGDFHRWNLLRTDRGLRAVDWEHAARAHPVWDLLLLAAEEPPRDDTPAGGAAVAALEAYYAAGPLSRLPYGVFLRLQQGARLFVAAARLARHRRLAAHLPPGPAAVAEQYAHGEQERVRRLLGLLTTP